MSRERVRPTREDTRQRLFEAAAELFVEQGIGGVSVEAIAVAAGFTRGAFYSNFADKEELVTAMLADHVAQSIQRYHELLARHRDPEDFLAALMEVDRSTQDPLGRDPLLHLELLLYAARATGQRGQLAEFLDARRRLIADIVVGTGLSSPEGRAPHPDQIGAMLLAMEDGFRVHQFIDPEHTPAESFLMSVAVLQQVLLSGRR